MMQILQQIFFCREKRVSQDWDARLCMISCKIKFQLYYILWVRLRQALCGMFGKSNKDRICLYSVLHD